MRERESSESSLAPGRALLAGVMAALLVWSAVPALAQERGLDRIRERYGEEMAEEISVVLREAREEGIPDGLILDKALEGAAKGVPANRLVSVLRSFRERLGEARKALAPEPSEDALLAGAEALQHGVGASVLRRISEAAGEDVAMALVAATELAGAGVAPAAARDLVERALESGQRGSALLHVSAAVRRRIRQGEAPAEAVQAVRRALEEGAFPGKTPPGPVPVDGTFDPVS